MKQVSTAEELDALPVGSVILDLGADGIEADAPVVACKTGWGDWQVMNNHPERRWQSREVMDGVLENLLVVVYTPADADQKDRNDG
jgi:hypothetical protein